MRRYEFSSRSLRYTGRAIEVDLMVGETREPLSGRLVVTPIVEDALPCLGWEIVDVLPPRIGRVAPAMGLPAHRVLRLHTLLQRA